MIYQEAYNIITCIFMFLIVISYLKAMLIGSDFSFLSWFKCGRKYWQWYNQRETFGEFLKRSPGDKYGTH